MSTPSQQLQHYLAREQALVHHQAMAHYERYLKLSDREQEQERRAIEQRLRRCQEEQKYGEYFRVQSHYQSMVLGLSETRVRLGHPA